MTDRTTYIRDYKRAKDAAVRRLIEAHRLEYEAYMDEERERLGIESRQAIRVRTKYRDLL